MSEKPSPRIVYCRCAYAQVVPQDVKDEVLRSLCESGASFETVADLCEMSARNDPRLKSIAEGGPAKIVACYPRAVKWLFHAAEAPLREGNEVEVLNMREESATNIAERLFNPEAAAPPAMHHD